MRRMDLPPDGEGPRQEKPPSEELVNWLFFYTFVFACEGLLKQAAPVPSSQAAGFAAAARIPTLISGAMPARTAIGRILLLSALLLAVSGSAYADDEEEQLRRYRQHVRPILDKHCTSCHNEADKKAGLNLDAYDFVVKIVRDGPVWVRVTELVVSGEMPPSNKPRLSPAERDTLLGFVEEVLEEALADPDPGQVVLRRLSNREYRYTILDLLGVDFDARAFFPADGSGGEGFDNQARVLYVTALLLERYYEAAEAILGEVYEDPARWRAIVPRPYRPSLLDRLSVWWHRTWHGEDVSLHRPVAEAEAVLFPFASRAYRRLLDEHDKAQLTEVFTKVYVDLEGAPDRFDRAVLESLKLVLISPHFLYRRELDFAVAQPYPVSGFELATRLSYFLWSSLPDDELMHLAYRGDLHEPAVLRAQVERMLQDPKARRFAESFASQWLGIDEILDEHAVDPERFPEFSPVLRRAMYEEAATFFHHVLTRRRTFLDLLDSDYAFLNETLAAHYGVDGVQGEALRLVRLADSRRGGVLGMGSVLTATSLPTRTSPVLRGKWVLEQLLGTPPPPPPPDVPELEEAKEAAHDELALRDLLSRHRAPSACFGCHQKMDPLGLGLENFDAVGRWRTHYGEVPIDASGVLVSGEAFAGPAELKRILLEKQVLFARNLARKMLSYALGRGIRFQDKYTVDHLTESLLQNDFHTVDFLTEVVLSFPFRYRKSDLPLEEA